VAAGTHPLAIWPRLLKNLFLRTLGNMRDLGVRSLFVTCELRHYEAVLSVERRSDAVLVRAFPVALVCTRCGIVGADTRRPLLVTEARVGGLERRMSEACRGPQATF
jgi:hypothetical protein